MHGEFEASPDEVEDLEEVVGDRDDEVESWQKTKQWMEMPGLRENFQKP